MTLLFLFNYKKPILAIATSVFCALLLTGCGSSSLDDFQEEGEGVTRSLVQELQSIHTREDLLNSSASLQGLFDKLVDVMIAAQQYRDKHPQLDQNVVSKPNRELSDQLRIELNRLFQIEGGREIIEKYQDPSLQRLDAFERKFKKR